MTRGKTLRAHQHNLLAPLKLRLPHMTKALKRIGDFILDSPNEVIYLSINEVADGSNVSIASVMRLCKELNYSSFAGFKLALASELAVMANGEERPLEKGYACQLSANLAEILQLTAQLVNEKDIEEIARTIINAKHIILFGVGASFIPASFFSYKLTRLGIVNFLSTDAHMAAMSVNVSDPDDLVLLFSSSGSVRDSTELAKLAKKKSVSTVAFTNRKKSPLVDICDRQLIAMGAESPLTSGSLQSKAGLLLILELLFDAICRISDVHAIRIQGAADAVSEKQY